MLDISRRLCIFVGMPRTALPEPNRLAELMRRDDLSRVDVAFRMGVGEATVYRWMTGRTSIPDSRKLALSELFDVPVTYLMRWDDPTNKAA
jgi:transcriptional regulator with XRE-family HTH domain